MIFPNLSRLLRCSPAFLYMSPIILYTATCSMWAQVSYRELDRATLQGFQGCSVPLRSQTGDLWCVEPGGRSISRYSGGGALVKRLRIEGMPQMQTSKVTFLQDIAIDGHGTIYVSAVWREQPRSFASGLFIFDSEGRYLRTVSLTPSIELRHTAVDSTGNIYTLGLDGDFVRRRTDYCLLVHKFAPNGNRITAFSSCPAGLILRTPAGTPGADFKKLSGDMDNGRLWVTGDKIYHLTPRAHMLRVFDSSGRQLNQVDFSVPAAPGTRVSPSPLASANDSMVRVLPISDGRYVIEWQHAEYLENTRNSSRYWAIHGADGNVLGNSASPPLFTTFLASDASGDAYALTASSTTGGQPQGIDIVHLRFGNN